jgi:hypothetical protein
MGLAIRIETTDGKGPYAVTDPGTFPHKGASMVRHPTPYYDFGHSDYRNGIFGFPGWRSCCRWFHHVERLRLAKTHRDVIWQIAFYRIETVYAQSERQMTFEGERITALPIDASGLSIARTFKKLSEGHSENVCRA